MHSYGHIQIGEIRTYSDCGANYTVKVKDKKMEDEYLIFTFTVEEVISRSPLSVEPAAVGSDFEASEWINTELPRGWSLT
jgi:hypothetical protein